jgi:drug/metabolite transporter (DMT)-like permease
MLVGVASYSLFALHDALVKGVVTDLPVVQILFVRSLVIATACLAVGRRKVVVDLIRSPNKAMLLMRAVLTLAAWCMYYSSGRYLQLAEMTTLYFVAPVLTIGLAVIFLKEQLTLARVGASAIGFFGVVVACNPGNFTLGWPAALALGAALLWAVAMILMRTISRSERTLTQILSMNLFYVSALAAISAWTWQAMDARQIAIVVGTGLIGGLAQYALVEAARRLPAGVLGTVEYSALIWSFVLGYLIWGETPAQAVYLGAALVVTAGLVLAWSERRGRRAVVDAP